MTLDLSRRGFCASLIAGPLVSGGVATAAAPLDAAGFADPAPDAKPHMLWMWMGCNVSRTGITRDLEAMASASIGGVLLMPLADVVTPDPAVILDSPTPEVIAFTDPWWALVRHAAGEAKRLGLTITLCNSPGYATSGGAWIPVELSMQELVWFTREVEGGKRFQGSVERGRIDPVAQGPFPVTWLPGENRLGKPEVPERNSYWRDVALVAVPEGPFDAARVIDLTGRMGSDGSVDWQVPPGRWTLYRFGHTTTGMYPSPAQWQARGLECDKMNPSAIRHHVASLTTMARRHLGPLAGTVVTGFYFDSYEAGDQRWTPAMPAEFAARRGYPLAPWLPVLAGRDAKAEHTARFRADFAETVRDLHEQVYWPVMQDALHDAGYRLWAEPYGGPWRTAEAIRHVDVSSSEFWTTKGFGPVDVARYSADTRAAGHAIVASEAFTATPGNPTTLWRETPAMLKPIADEAMCDGVNAAALHMYAHQPWGDHVVPGMTMGQWGTHFGRNQTWWEPGKGFFRYLWRCQAMLRRGRFVAEAARIEQPSAGRVRTTRRREGETDIHFVANLDGARAVAATVRIDGAGGRQPEWWDAVDGTARDLPEFRVEGGVLAVPLVLPAGASGFLVLRRAATGPGSGSGTGRNGPPRDAIATLAGPWRATFDPRARGPGMVTLPDLVDWTTHGDAGVRHYSGTAVYETEFVLPRALDGRAFWLDLGTVCHLAQVTLNGRDLGTLWTAPWRLALGGAVRRGRNRLRIAVTNCWANRLIGDEAYPADCEWGPTNAWFKAGGPLVRLPRWVHEGGERPEPRRSTFATWNYFTENAPPPLDPSGLIGPVRVLAGD